MVNIELRDDANDDLQTWKCLLQTMARRRVHVANACRMFGVAAHTEFSNNFIYILYMYVLFVVFFRKKKESICSRFVRCLLGGVLGRANR